MPDPSAHPRRLLPPAGLWATCLLCLLSASASAQVQVTLPLDGYYRPGRAMPVRLTANFPSAPQRSSLRLIADGTLPTQLDLLDGRSTAIIPWLPLDRPANPRWQHQDLQQPLPDLPLRPLADTDRLIAAANVDPATVPSLFPGRSIIPIRLDPADPLPGPALAWETLDALAIDASTAARLAPEKLTSLLASGTTIIVRSDSPPDARWPWRPHAEGWWLLRHDPAGPQDASFTDAVYRPVWNWQPAWPPAFRRRIVLCAAIFSILVLGLALWRSRWAAVGVLFLSALAVGLLAAWSRSQTPLLERNGEILVITGPLLQRDHWTYLASTAAGSYEIPSPPSARPILASPEHLRTLDMTLHCATTGDPQSFHFTLRPGLKLAILTRTLTLESPPAASPAEPSPLADLARDLYLAPGQTIRQLPSEPGRWPTVLIDRSAPTPTH